MLAGFLVLGLLIAVILTVPTNAQIDENETIPDRVFAGTIALGGLTREEATEKIQEHMKKLGQTKFKLTAGKNNVEVTAAQLGLSWSNKEILDEAVRLGKSGNLIARYKAMKDLEHEDKVYDLAFKLNNKKITAALAENSTALETKAVDAQLSRLEGQFNIVPGSQGVTINVKQSIKVIKDYIAADWNQEAGEIALVADVVDPRGTEEELGKVKDVLGAFDTDYSSSGSGRAQNVANGASRVNGHLIYPGEVFSVYEAVSPFDAENGYKLAGSYENGTTVETYGGGICQVSTTLYNAVIRAELEIVERYAHSMTVAYVDPSADAAIAGTVKDLKFKNNTDAPIYIEGYTSGMQIGFTIFGHETRESNREIVFESETTGTSNPGTEYRASGAPIGSISQVQSSHTGKTAKLWKIIKIDGVEQSREEFNSSNYQASPTIIEVGVASASAEATAQMHAAIATQNSGTINSAAATWSNAAIAARQQAEQEAAEKEQMVTGEVGPDGLPILPEEAPAEEGNTPPAENNDNPPATETKSPDEGDANTEQTDNVEPEEAADEEAADEEAN